MKLTITKKDGTVLVKEFNQDSIEQAKSMGWTEYERNPKPKKTKKSKKWKIY